MLRYAIGDVHGMLAQLRQLLAMIDADAAGRPYELVMLGDYIDRGPDSKGVLDLLMARENTVCLLGNHEDMLLQAYAENDVYGNITYWWLSNGGADCLESFGGRAGIDRLSQRIPSSYIDWLKTLPRFYETEKFIFVHAGLLPGLSLAEHDVRDAGSNSMIWIRDRFLNSTYDWGKKIIHGHTPAKNVEERPNRINLDTDACCGGFLSAARLNPDGTHAILQVLSKPSLSR